MTSDSTTAEERAEHSSRCYWDFTECRWVCRPGVPGSAGLERCTASPVLTAPAARPAPLAAAP